MRTAESLEGRLRDDRRAVSCGGFFIPTFAITLIAGTNPRTTFAVIFALYLIAAVLVLGLPERGFRHAEPSVGAVDVS